MTDFETETEEPATLRHAPGWVDAILVAVILLTEFALLFWVSQELAAQPMRYDRGTLRAATVATLFVGAGLQFLVLAVPPLVEITGRRIQRRSRLGWDEPETLCLDAIERIDQQGWRLTVSGGGKHLSFLCLPPFAPRIRRALERSRSAAR